MNISNKQKFGLAVLPLLFVFLAHNEYKYYTANYTLQKEIVSKGIVTDRYDNVYSCGNKNQDKCYARYLVVNGEAIKVTDDTYLRTRVRDTVTLTEDVVKFDNTNREIWYDIHMCLLVIDLFAIAGFLILLLHWKLFKDDYREDSFIKHLFGMMK